MGQAFIRVSHKLRFLSDLSSRLATIEDACQSKKAERNNLIILPLFNI